MNQKPDNCGQAHKKIDQQTSWLPAVSCLLFSGYPS